MLTFAAYFRANKHTGNQFILHLCSCIILFSKDYSATHCWFCWHDTVIVCILFQQFKSGTFLTEENYSANSLWTFTTGGLSCVFANKSLHVCFGAITVSHSSVMGICWRIHNSFPFSFLERTFLRYANIQMWEVVEYKYFVTVLKYIFLVSVLYSTTYFSDDFWILLLTFLTGSLL